MNKYYEQSRHEMLAFIPDSNVRRVLDVGCGQGGFASLLKENLSAEVWGIEPVEKQARAAGKLLDKVFAGGFEEVYKDLPKGGFDCIIFNDVLEHVVDPGKILLDAKPLLSEQGVLVCSIPNVRYFPNLYELLVKKDWRYREAGVLDRTHLRFFTAKSMRRMFRESGYDEIVMCGINPVKSKKMQFLYLLGLIISFGQTSDCKYQQYACVMSPDKRLE